VTRARACATARRQSTWPQGLWEGGEVGGGVRGGGGGAGAVCGSRSAGRCEAGAYAIIASLVWRAGYPPRTPDGMTRSCGSGASLAVLHCHQSTASTGWCGSPAAGSNPKELTDRPTATDRPQPTPALASPRRANRFVRDPSGGRHISGRRAQPTREGGRCFTCRAVRRTRPRSAACRYRLTPKDSGPLSR